MSSNKDKATERLEQLSATRRLRALKPLPPKHQFLISWDARKRILRYGCGHGEGAVTICSDGKLERAVWTNDSEAKLSVPCVKRFMAHLTNVSGTSLLTQCKGCLRSYAHFSDERLYTLLAVWAIATYMYPVFSHFGYLFLHSKFPRSGKTRVQEILSHLCFEATNPLNAPTIPTIRETAAEGHTVVLDTLERWKEKNAESHSAAMELLDAGFRNGGTVPKMVPAGDGKWKKEAFRVYAPYVLAAIAKDSLTDTALDRSFVIEMHRKPITIKKKKYSFFRCEQEVQILRDDMYIWALENATSVAVTYESSKLEAEVDALELNDRAADIWKPLFAVARVLGCVAAWQELTSFAVEMGRDPEAAERDRVRAIACSLRKLENGTGSAEGITSDFVKHLLNDGIEVTESSLHDMLSHWGFAQTSRRLPQGPRRAWALPKSKLIEIENENGCGSDIPLS